MSSTEDHESTVPVDCPALDRWPTFNLDYAVETVGSAEQQCTVFPTNVSEDRRFTAWITATGDAFVSVDDVR